METQLTMDDCSTLAFQTSDAGVSDFNKFWRQLTGAFPGMAF
jgi:hypothetical protein